MKQLAIKIAKQMANEPAEILKTAAESLISLKPVSKAGENTIPDRKIPPIRDRESSKKDLRLVQALEQEIEDIRKEKEKKRLEEIKNQSPAKVLAPIELPKHKRGRKMFGLGRKQAAEKQTTRVERPLPPSG